MSDSAPNGTGIARVRSSTALTADSGRRCRGKAPRQVRVRLVTATRELRIEDAVYEGRPIMLVDGRLEPVPSIYLARWAGRTIRSAWTYARALVEWWCLLLAARRKWSDVSISDAVTFASARSRSTARLQLTAVSGFYEWAHASGWIEHRPFKVIGHSQRRLAEPGAGAGAPAVRLPKTPRRQPKTIAACDFTSVLAASSRRDPGLLLRDELTAECGRFMGLRRWQVAGMTVAQFAFASTDAIAYQIDLDPRFTKGGHEQCVLVPRQLVQKVQKYLSIYRARIVDKCRARSSRYREPAALFLTIQGRPMSETYISKTWRRSALRAGIDKRFHANRHSHGTGFARGALRFGIRPIRAVMSQLGHRLERSSSTYVDLAELDRDLLARAHAVNDLWEQEHRA